MIWIAVLLILGALAFFDLTILAAAGFIALILLVVVLGTTAGETVGLVILCALAWLLWPPVKEIISYLRR